MTMRISKDRVDMDNKELQKPVLKNYGEAVITDNSGSTYTIDLTKGNVFDITLTDNCAFTFANPPISGTAGSFTLILTQDSTGSRTVTWPAAVKWLGGTTPTLTADPLYADILVFATVNGGTTWYGATSAQDYDSMPPYIPVYIPYGYFGGGLNQSYVSVATVDRIDYSNDTATAAVKGPLSSGQSSFAATGNSSYGYFGGGYASTVNHIDYSNDTATATVKGPLSSERFFLAATGTSSYGYFGGGRFIGALSTIDRIDFVNDTATATVKGPLDAARYKLAATGNSSYGYFGGGSTITYAVDRIDYSDDTAVAIAKAPLSVAPIFLTATGNSSFGYFGGGNNVQTSETISMIDRIDYSNDTATAVVKGPLSAARIGLAATGNSSYGYFSGSYFSPTFYSIVDRIDYSNDTATAVVKGPLSAARYLLAATNHNPV